jgi:hypothetical protein
MVALKDLLFASLNAAPIAALPLKRSAVAAAACPISRSRRRQATSLSCINQQVFMNKLVVAARAEPYRKSAYAKTTK